MNGRNILFIQTIIFQKGEIWFITKQLKIFLMERWTNLVILTCISNVAEKMS